MKQSIPRTARRAELTRAAEGRAVAILGDTVVAKGNVAGSDLLMSLTIVPPGSGVPVHHHPSPETFVMVDGALTFHLGDGDVLRELAAGPGDIVTVPLGVWHAFRNSGARSARFVIVHDRSLAAFFEEAGSTVRAGEPPSQDAIEHVLRTARAHGMAIRA